MDEKAEEFKGISDEDKLKMRKQEFHLFMNRRCPHELKKTEEFLHELSTYWGHNYHIMEHLYYSGDENKKIENQVRKSHHSDYDDDHEGNREDIEHVYYELFKYNTSLNRGRDD